MKFTCNKDDLVNNVSIVQRAVSSNSTVQILNGILIESDNNSKIKLTGYDLQTGIEADMDADVFERGSVVLDSKFFGDIISINFFFIKKLFDKINNCVHKGD